LLFQRTDQTRILTSPGARRIVGPMFKFAKPNDNRGFTLVEIMTVVAIIGLLAAMCLPNVMHSRLIAQTGFCIDNLRMLDGAKQQWAMEHGAVPTSQPMSSDIQPYIGRGSGILPVCPLDSHQMFSTSYSLNNCQNNPSCLISPATHVFP